MRRIAFALLCVFGLASLGFLTSTPATAGDYGYYGGGYYGHRYYGGGYYGHRYYSGGYYGHRSYGVGYYHRPYYGGGYYRRYHNRQVWYSSSCCYRRVVRHTRAVRYVPTHRSYYGGYYGRPYHNYGYYRPYSRYGYYRPYYHHYYSDYVYRPYRHYYLGYDSVGYASYAGCGRVPLADGRGGWVWSRRAGCF